jgi:hypothetical protein
VEPDSPDNRDNGARRDAGLPNTPYRAEPTDTGSNSVSNHAFDWASDTIAFIGAFLRASHDAL